MQALVSPSRLLICSIRSLIADGVWGISRGGMRITSPGLRIVTVLFPLETSIPTAFMIKTPLKRISVGVQGGIPDLLIAYSIYWEFHTNEGSTCVKRMLRMRAGWLTYSRTLSPRRYKPDLLPHSF